MTRTALVSGGNRGIGLEVYRQLRAAVSLAEWADTIVWLATLRRKGPNGGFFHQRLSLGW